MNKDAVGGLVQGRASVIAGLSILVLLAAGCLQEYPHTPQTGGTASPNPPNSLTQEHALVITEQDNGESFTLQLGALAFLRLSSSYLWDAPQVDGAAVSLLPVYYESDPGYQEWQVQADSTGAAQIVALGHRNPPGPETAPLVTVRVTVTVSSR